MGSLKFLGCVVETIEMIAIYQLKCVYTREWAGKSIDPIFSLYRANRNTHTHTHTESQIYINGRWKGDFEVECILQ